MDKRHETPGLETKAFVAQNNSTSCLYIFLFCSSSSKSHKQAQRGSKRHLHIQWIPLQASSPVLGEPKSFYTGQSACLPFVPEVNTVPSEVLSKPTLSSRRKYYISQGSSVPFTNIPEKTVWDKDNQSHCSQTCRNVRSHRELFPNNVHSPNTPVSTHHVPQHHCSDRSDQKRLEPNQLA